MKQNNMLLKNALCYIDGAFFKKDIFVINGKIADFKPGCCGFDTPEVVDCGGAYVLPGFIDIHTHGANGADVNSASVKDFENISSFFASKGTTSYLASVLTDSEEKTLHILSNIASFMVSQSNGAALLGAHLEGPFLSPVKKGAMPAQYLKTADLDLFERYYDTGAVKYITVAPEVEGVLPFIESVSEKAVVAIGHSAADYQTSLQAVQKGAAVSTHTFNAMQGIDRTEPSILGACIDTDIYNEIIADGRHVHPANIRMLYRLKGNKRVVAITDSIEATGLPDGAYRLGANDVTLAGADAFITGTSIRAGSVLTMDNALKNLMRFLDIPLEEAVPMLTENPADLLHLNKGYIRIGYDADFVLMDKDYKILKTIVGGRVVYSA